MFGKGLTPAVLFLDRGRLQAFVTGQQVASWEIPSNLMRDLEIVDENGFVTALTTFLGQLKLVGNPAVLILAEALYFAKAISAQTEEEKLKLQQEFFDTVPCEMLLTKTYPAESGGVAVAVCREFIDELKEAFGKVGLPLVIVVPVVALGQQGAKRWLDLELGSWVVREVNRLLPLSLVKSQEVAGPSETGVAPRFPKLLFGLVAALGVLLLILVAVLFSR